MLTLRKGLPAAVTVPLPGGAAILVRPATAFEIDMAMAGVARMLTGLIEGSEAAAAVITIIGGEFTEPEFASKAWRDAAAQRLALLELATMCTERLIGVADDNGPIEGRPDKAQLAMLLRDNECAKRINQAISARVHDESAEGEGLPVSPNGAAKAGDPIAPSADATISRVPADDAATTASVVPK